MELQALKETVESTLSVKIDTNVGSKNIYDGKKIFAFMAFQTGTPTLREVGKALNRKHPIVIHYRDSGNNLLKFDPNFKDRFIKIKSKF